MIQTGTSDDWMGLRVATDGYDPYKTQAEGFYGGVNYNFDEEFPD